MVRPQPTQTFRASSTQTLTQGDATVGPNGAGGEVMTERADNFNYGDTYPILQTLFADKNRHPGTAMSRWTAKASVLEAQPKKRVPEAP